MVVVVVVKGYTNSISRFNLSLSLKVSINEDRSAMYIYIYILKKIPLPGYRTFHGVLIRYKEQVDDERKLNNFEETSSFVAFKGILPPLSISLQVHFVSLKSVQYIYGTGTREREREKNVCLNFAFLCVAPCSSTRLGSTRERFSALTLRPDVYVSPFFRLRNTCQSYGIIKIF